MAGKAVAGALEVQAVEISVALDVEQDLGVAAGDVDVVEHHVADRLGDVIADVIATVDLNGGVGIGVGRRRVGATGNGDVLDQRVAGEAEQDDVAVAVLAAVAVVLEGGVGDVHRLEPEPTAAGADAVDRIADESEFVTTR